MFGNNNTLIGIDPGFGNWKLWGENGGIVYASHASQANGKKYANMVDDAKRADLIQFGNSQYYTGKLAPLQGTPVVNLGLERLLGGNEIRALFYGAMTQYINQYGTIDGRIDARVGVPASLLEKDSKERTISDMTGWLVGDHTWTCNGGEYHIKVNSIKLNSQAIGALYDYAYTLDGKSNPDHVHDIRNEIGIVSIGYNTVELAAIAGGNSMLDNMLGSDMYGVRRLLEALDGGDKTRLGFIDLKLRNRSFNGELAPAKEGWSEQVKSYIGSAWGKNAKKLARVLVVGGGATDELLRRDLDLFFVGKAYFADDVIGSISRGLYKKLIKDAK